MSGEESEESEETILKVSSYKSSIYVHVYGE